MVTVVWAYSFDLDEKLYRNFDGETSKSRDDRETLKSILRRLWLDIIELAQHKEHS